MTLTRTQRLILSRGAQQPQESKEVQIGRLVRDEVQRALRGIRQPQDGKDGRDGERGERGPRGHKGEPGKDAEFDYEFARQQIAEMVAAESDRIMAEIMRFAETQAQSIAQSVSDGVGIRDVAVDGPTLRVALTDDTERALDFSALIPATPVHLVRVEMVGNDIVAFYSDGEQEVIGSIGGVSANRAKAISREIRFVTTTTDYTAKNEDDVIEADSSDGAITITIPDGRKTWLEIKRVGDNDVTVKAETAQIEDEDSRVLNLDLYAIQLAWNGTQYREF